MTTNELIAHNLKRARGLRAWSQSELAERLRPTLGWTSNTISQVETGVGGKRVRHFTVEQVVTLAEALDVPLAFMLDGILPKADHEVQTNRPTPREVHIHVHVDTQDDVTLKVES